MDCTICRSNKKALISISNATFVTENFCNRTETAFFSIDYVITFLIPFSLKVVDQIVFVVISIYIFFSFCCFVVAMCNLVHDTWRIYMAYLSCYINPTPS